MNECIYGAYGNVPLSMRVSCSRMSVSTCVTSVKVWARLDRLDWIWLVSRWISCPEAIRGARRNTGEQPSLRPDLCCRRGRGVAGSRLKRYAVSTGPKNLAARKNDISNLEWGANFIDWPQNPWLTFPFRGSHRRFEWHNSTTHMDLAFPPFWWLAHKFEWTLWSHHSAIVICVIFFYCPNKDLWVNYQEW